MADNTKNAYYDKNFDPASLTKPQLRAALLEIGVVDMPATSAKKQVLVDLFSEKVKESSKRGRSKTVATKDDRKASKSRRRRTRARSKAKAAGESAARTSTTPSPARKSPRKSTQIDKSPSPSTRRAVSKSPASRKTSDSPLNVLQSKLPKYNDSPSKATSKLYDRLEYIASVNNYPAASSAMHKTPQKSRKDAIRYGQSEGKRGFVARIAAGLAAFLQFLFIFGLTLFLGLYLRTKYFYPPPYCTLTHSLVDDGKIHKGKGAFTGFIDSTLRGDCIECPAYAKCIGGSLRCQEGYLKKANIFFYGHTCVPDQHKLALIHDIIKKIKEILGDLAGQVECGQLTPVHMIKSSEQIAAILKEKYPNAPWNSTFFDSLYNLALMDIGNNPASFDLAISHNSLDAMDNFKSTRPRIPVKCRMRLFFSAFYAKYRLVIWSALGTLLLAALLSLSYNRKKKKSKRIEELCQTVLQLLAEQDALNRRDPLIASAISTHQLRDALFHKSSQRVKDRLWPSVCKAISRNSNVRESLMSIKGEQHRVWEWIGSDVLSPLSPSSKFN